MNDFFQLQEGYNRFRIITQPYQYLSHPDYLPKGNKYFEKKLDCTSFFGKCDFCNKGEKPHSRWILGVISRDDQNVYLLDIGFLIFNQLRTLARNPTWGNPEDYDIDIYMNHGEYVGEYSVTAVPKTPLSAQDQLSKDNFSLDILKDLTAPINKNGQYITFDSAFSLCGSSD